MPTPGAQRRLAALIRQETLAAGGALPFSRFMERCLYAPGLGYYSAGSAKFAPPAIFVTATELGRCSPAASPRRWRRCCGSWPAGEFLEIGGGSGAFAEVMLKRLLALDAMPSRYAILEPSADLRERQRERLGRG
jgi:SAM-dependent MidA family methyltransferase